MTLNFFSLHFDNIEVEQAIAQAMSFLNGDKQHYIVTPNPEIVVRAEHDHWFREALWNADMSLIDGFGLAQALRFLSGAKIYRNTGSDFILELFKSVGASKTFFFLGTRFGVGKRAAQIAGERFQTKVVGFAEPLPKLYSVDDEIKIMRSDEHQKIIDDIRESKPEILVVALGHNLQEKWMYQFLKDVPSVKLAIGVGGALDYLSGDIPRAPKWLRVIGGEWAWRLIVEPWRFKRIIDATIVFPYVVLRWCVRIRYMYRSSYVGCLINKEGKLLLVSRADHPTEWQFPQGGKEYGETAEQAILREMHEELGTDKLRIVWQSRPNVYRYDFTSLPGGDRAARYYGYRGQQQTIFFLQFLGDDNDIHLDASEHLSWQWVQPENVLNVLSFARRDMGKILLQEFHDHATKN